MRFFFCHRRYNEHFTIYLCMNYPSGFLDSEPLRETDEDSVSDVNLDPSAMTEEEREEIQQELCKVRFTHVERTRCQEC